MLNSVGMGEFLDINKSVHAIKKGSWKLKQFFKKWLFKAEYFLKFVFPWEKVFFFLTTSTLLLLMQNIFEFMCQQPHKKIFNKFELQNHARLMTFLFLLKI